MNEPQSIEPDSVWVKTNPAWCYSEFIRCEQKNKVEPRKIHIKLARWINQVQDAGIRFPTCLWANFISGCGSPVWLPPKNAPRVVGLVRSKGGNDSNRMGFVTRIEAKRSSVGWSVSDGLPFKVGHILDAFSKLILNSDLSSVVPEANPFEINDTLGQTPYGSSMNIAGLLAVIDAWNHHGGVKGNDPLLCACALVKPSNQKLVTVGGVREKLCAFRREFGKGSLVVCTPETASQQPLTEHFEHVWQVEDFTTLAQFLNSAGLLETVFAEHRLTKQCVAEARKIIFRLTEMQGPKDALDFARRLNRAASAGQVESLRVKQKVDETLEDFNRHIGNFEEAVTWSERAVLVLDEHKSLTSFQEEVEAKARLASAMYDAHRFQDGAAKLRELIVEDQGKPRMLNAESKVMLYNTYARLLVALDIDGWEIFYQNSIELQRVFDPAFIGRTRSYLIFGLLRRNRFEHAQSELTWFNENETDPYTQTFVSFHRAELYRKNPKCGVAFRQDDKLETSGRGHAFGFYLQATARQADRTESDRKTRFERAISAFLEEIGPYTDQNILNLFAMFMSLATAPENSIDTRRKIEQFFNDCRLSHLRDWYREALGKSPIDIEFLLNRIPYF